MAILKSCFKTLILPKQAQFNIKKICQKLDGSATLAKLIAAVTYMIVVTLNKLNLKVQIVNLLFIGTPTVTPTVFIYQFKLTKKVGFARGQSWADITRLLENARNPQSPLSLPTQVRNGPLQKYTGSLDTSTRASGFNKLSKFCLRMLLICLKKLFFGALNIINCSNRYTLSGSQWKISRKTYRVWRIHICAISILLIRTQVFGLLLSTRRYHICIEVQCVQMHCIVLHEIEIPIFCL